MSHPTSTVVIRVPLAELERLAEARDAWCSRFTGTPESWQVGVPAREVAAFLVGVALEHTVQFYRGLLSEVAPLDCPPDPAQISIHEYFDDPGACAPS